MALTNEQCAWVNRSSSNIPVYGTLGSYNGYYSPGGNTIGNIYPNEFYTTRKNNQPWYEIRFRNSSGNMATGYITTLPQGYTYPEATWVQYQEPYHFYNSNGSTLTYASTATINNATYYVFTVKKDVTYRKPDGTLGGTISAGTKLATLSSTTGNTYAGHMIFYRWRQPTSAVWSYFGTSDYVFVDLGLSQGSEPSTRPIW